MASFIEIFGDYIDTPVADEVARGEILSMQVDRDSREMRLALQMDGLAAHAALTKLGRALCAALGLQEVKLQPRYAPESFSSECLSELVACIGARGVPVNGSAWRLAAHLSEPRRAVFSRADPLRKPPFGPDQGGIRQGGFGCVRRGA